MAHAFTLQRTDATNPDFIALVKQLDAYLAEKDGDEHAFYDQYNHIQQLSYVLLAYENGVAVACGAIKPYASGVMEVKRMFTLPAARGKGVATAILSALEAWAKELGYTTCILETGKKQVEAVSLYPKCGYTVIANYGQYAGIDNSICFEKRLL